MGPAAPANEKEGTAGAAVKRDAQGLAKRFSPPPQRVEQHSTACQLSALLCPSSTQWISWCSASVLECPCFLSPTGVLSPFLPLPRQRRPTARGPHWTLNTRLATSSRLFTSCDTKLATCTRSSSKRLLRRVCLLSPSTPEFYRLLITTLPAEDTRRTEANRTNTRASRP